MTTCSPGKSLVLHKTKRQGRTKRTNESYSISDETHIDSNDSGSLSQKNERKKTAVRKQAPNHIDDTTIAVCRNEQICNNFEMKLSSLKAQNWLKNLQFNNHVSSFTVVADFNLFQLCVI